MPFLEISKAHTNPLVGMIHQRHSGIDWLGFASRLAFNAKVI